MNLESKVESILFFKAEPVSVSYLARTLDVSEADIREALKTLQENLKNRGIRLLFKNDEVLLGTAPEMGEFLKDLSKRELSQELSKAALETLTIVLYRGPINKSSIDFIRGVNSQFILRNLLVRGLVERVPDEKDKRILLYRPTFDLLQHLGVTRVEDLPDYGAVAKEITAFEEMFEAGE